MKSHIIGLVTSLLIITSWVVKAQEVAYLPDQNFRSKEGIGIRVGINNSFPAVTAALLKPGLPITYQAGITPRYGFYIGGYYYKDLSLSPLTFRLNTTLQMKGVGSNYNGKPVRNAIYYYIGAAPQIGIHLTNQLTLYTGVEANLQVIRDNAYGGGFPLELGTGLQVAYRFGQFSAELGYFRGFTRTDRYENYNAPVAPIIINFYNQNLQLGVLYNLGR